jgi:outer membrane protein assembly factor BamD (BamD/ComL family)
MRSTLAAEVALLDGVRRSLASGVPGDALQSLARYERRFPAGLLASDAEVLTIEALRAKGDAEGARARATRFLAKYPRDPHTERVRALAEKP